MAVGIDYLDNEELRRTAERLSSERLAQRASGARAAPSLEFPRPRVSSNQPSPEAQAYRAARDATRFTPGAPNQPLRGGPTGAPRIDALNAGRMPSPLTPDAPASAAAAEPPAPSARAGGVRGALRTVGRVALPAMAIAGAAKAGMTPTERMREEIGMDPNGGSLLGDLAARAAGTLRRVGDVISGGLAEPIGEWIGGKVADWRDEATGINDQFRRRPSGSRGSSAPALAANTPAAQAHPPGTIFRRGNEFSDQPLAGGVVFDPRTARGGFIGPTNPDPEEAARRHRELVNYLNQREAERREQIARRDAAIDASINAARQQEGQRMLEAAARRARMDATSATNRGLWPRHRAALLEQANTLAAQAAGAAAQPVATATRTPEQEVELAGSRQAQQIAAQQAEAEGIAAGIQNRQLQRSMEVQQQLEQINGADPTTRRALIDRALVAQGKDPDAGRYMAIDVLGPDGMTSLRGVLDTRSGQVIGAGAVGNGPGAKPSLEEFMKAAKADPRNRGVSDDELRAYYQRRYGT